ncbi:hypothetical protein BZJ21_07095 [Salinivibrio costicola subsp. alcaliphilus]|uniref:Stress-induced protein n=1 Tax=Salinivibrio costicola subsp. alcaliphilus TaxID=272773 RepID=A0ABX3KRD4_SALCS|nr:hypothetical protein BZJ21_07095 [Salinivibrio costicola subsp. alcaliphilus]
MGILDGLLGGKSESSDQRHGVIDYGKNKNAGGHDHRTNRGNDRTPSQKSGDEKRRKDKN